MIDNKNKEKLENEMWIDLEKDDSIQKFVTSNLSFNDKSYIPSNLVSIYSNFVFDAK
ncbi:MAG: hypothetical protein P1U46_00820 [Patescibacteria group bacterium]|nr:hypothetical protein [Patescibacteria group bacterium]